VTIAFATFKRPHGLKRLLDSIAALNTRDDVSVVVADNDAQGQEGYNLVEDLRWQYRFPLQAFVVPTRGIAQVRNALIAHALKTKTMAYLAMPDDDGAVEPRWLEALLRTQEDTGAHVVAGAVEPAFDEPPPEWAQNAPGIAPLHNVTGIIDMIHGTGNTLFTRECLELAGTPVFDPAYALTGGEDKELFTRLKAKGAVFAWCDEAVIRETMPASRVSLSWIMKRAYRIGNSDMRVFLQYREDFGAVMRELAKIGGAFVAAPFLTLIRLPQASRRLDGLRLLCRAAGKVVALFGRHYHEYATTHGK
jgi:glycosyltransferase involved in cell wall biosynthesis